MSRSPGASIVTISCPSLPACRVVSSGPRRRGRAPSPYSPGRHPGAGTSPRRVMRSGGDQALMATTWSHSAERLLLVRAGEAAGLAALAQTTQRPDGDQQLGQLVTVTGRDVGELRGRAGLGRVPAL